MYNPADFMLQLVNSDFPERYDAALVLKYGDSAERAAVVAKVAEAMAGSKKAPAGSSKVSPLSSFLTLCHRFSLNNAKNPGIYWVRLVMYVMLCLMIGLMYIGLGDEHDCAPSQLEMTRDDPRRPRD